MPDGRRTTCQSCGERAEKVGPISWRGKCGTCGPRLAREAADNLHYHRGPIHQHWRRQMAACVGARLLDDASETG